MRLLLAGFLLAAALVPALAAPKQKAKPAPPPAFSSNDDIMRWIDGYKAKPEPARLPAAVQAMSRLGLFKDMDGAGVYIGFMAGVIGMDAATAEASVAKLFPMPPDDQVAIVKAIAWSGLPEWKPLLRSFVERMPARKVLIEHYLYGKLPALADLGLQTGPIALDANWGYYFASGKLEPVRRIIGALAWTKEGDDVEKLTIAGMAKWTLAKNASRDSDLLDLLKKELGRQPKPVAAELRDVIVAVETFEIGKIKKDAVASIDDLSRKGPASTRNMSWWAQAGSTMIALGCVAAAALGQVEFGIPCVVGGPLSTAAAKYLIPGQQ